MYILYAYVLQQWFWLTLYFRWEMSWVLPFYFLTWYLIFSISTFCVIVFISDYLLLYIFILNDRKSLCVFQSESNGFLFGSPTPSDHPAPPYSRLSTMVCICTVYRLYSVVHIDSHHALWEYRSLACSFYRHSVAQFISGLNHSCKKNIDKRSLQCIAQTFDSHFRLYEQSRYIGGDVGSLCIFIPRENEGI